MKELTEKQKYNFLNKFKQGFPEECWEWLASKSQNGYGNVRLNGRTEFAHRISYLIFNGPIPERMCVCHTCDNRLCCNPKHLWLGTNLDNHRDAKKKGRTAKLYGRNNGVFGKHPDYSGEKNNSSKLRKVQVVEIRNSDLKGVILAEKFMISQQAISDIRHLRSWKNLGLI